MGKLTTHVLDTSSGRPAQNIQIELRRIDEGAVNLLATFTTNHDGRCDAPLLADEAFSIGVYELTFKVGRYFSDREKGGGGDLPPFLTDVPIRFGVSDADAHYHVPLLISPYGYSTYRGS